MSGLTGSWASAAVAIVAVAASATLTRDRCMGCPSEEWRAPSLVLVGTWERTLSKFRGADNREATGPFDTALNQRQQAMCFCGGVTIKQAEENYAPRSRQTHAKREFTEIFVARQQNASIVILRSGENT